MGIKRKVDMSNPIGQLQENIDRVGYDGLIKETTNGLLDCPFCKTATCDLTRLKCCECGDEICTTCAVPSSTGDKFDKACQFCEDL